MTGRQAGHQNYRKSTHMHASLFKWRYRSPGACALRRRRRRDTRRPFASYPKLFTRYLKWSFTGTRRGNRLGRGIVVWKMLILLMTLFRSPLRPTCTSGFQGNDCWVTAVYPDDLKLSWFWLADKNRKPFSSFPRWSTEHSTCSLDCNQKLVVWLFSH